jgi:hypothetical protein
MSKRIIIRNPPEPKDFSSLAILAIQMTHTKAEELGLGKGKGGTGSIKCPVCQNKLLFSVASLNGHIWGK